MGRRATTSALPLALLAAISMMALTMLPTAVMAAEATPEGAMGAAPLPSSSSVGRAAARRRDLLQASSIESAAVASNVNCTALPGLQACAEPLCFESYELRRNATTGALECRRLPSASALALNLLLPIYDGDYLFLSAGDNALASTSVVDNTNAGRRFTTREGSFRVRAPFAERVRNTGTVLGGWLGRFSQRRASAEVASSWSVGTNGQRPLQTEASIGALPKVAATSKRGLYGPGFTAVGRGAAASDDPAEQGGSVEGNVALDVLSPFGILAGGRRRSLLQRQDQGGPRRQHQQQRRSSLPPSSSSAAAAAEDEEDMAALRAQLGRLVAKGAVKSDVMYDLRGGGATAGGEGAAMGEEDADGGGGSEGDGQLERPTHQRQRQQQQPALRTSTSGGGGGGGPGTGGISTGGGGLTGGPIAPALLPFCRPRLGLFCSDTDLLRTLRKARPDAVLLSDDAPAWGEAFASGEVDPRLLIRTDPIASAVPAASAVVNSKLDGRLGTLFGNGVLKSTLASTGFGLAPAAAAIGAAPALAFTMGQNRAEGTLDLRGARARLVVFPGANFGSLTGLTQVDATQGK